MEQRDSVSRELWERIHDVAVETARLAQVVLDHDARLTDHAEHAEATDETITKVRADVNELATSLARIEGHADADRERNQHETPIKAAVVGGLFALAIYILGFLWSAIPHHP